MSLTRDAIYSIAIFIRDRVTWLNFALASKQCATICQTLLSRQKPIILESNPYPIKDVPIICKSCKSTNCIINTVQIRAADESSTIKGHCNDCGVWWLEY